MKKIKWLNVAKTLILLLALYIVVHDIYLLFIYPFFTSYLATWTYFGFITFGISLYYVIAVIEEFVNGGK